MFLQNPREKIVVNKKIKEGSVYFIKFIDNQEEKWCHAHIDKVEADSILFRTAINAEPILVLDINILEIGKNENQVDLDDITIEALYRGEIKICSN